VPDPFPRQAPLRVPPERVINNQLTERRQVIRKGGREGFYRQVLARYLALPHLFRTPGPWYRASVRGINQ
jgi:hypothetical protein